MLEVKKIFNEIKGKPFSLWFKKSKVGEVKKLCSVDIELVGDCNLNCKGCSHFSPLVEKHGDDVNIEKLAQDLEQLRKVLGDSIERISLLGGEPLLFKECEAAMTLVRGYFKDAEVVLLTNGLLLLQMKDSFWTTIKDNNIVLEITKYPIGLDYKAINKEAKSHGVKIRYYGRTGYVQKTLYRLPLVSVGKYSSRESFDGCFMARQCYTLKNGKLFPCSVSAYINRFNDTFNCEIPLTQDDYADIYSESKESIIEKITNPIPMCAYCDVQHRDYGLKFEQSKREKCEWM